MTDLGGVATAEPVVGRRRHARRARPKALVRELPDPTAPIPWGGENAHLRTVLVALDHEAYHVGQIVLLRRLLGAWAG
jgi:hypothetical protein